MSIQQALRISRTSRGLKQSDLDVPVTQQMISAIEKGTRQMAADLAPHFNRIVDHHAMYFETMREATDGVGPSYLDGPNVDLHRSAVREKCLEELQEAVDAISHFATNKPPGAEGDTHRRKREEHLLQVMDAIQASYMYIGVQCEEYGFSMRAINQKHRKKLESLRYVKSH
ncbi:hypothetical protein [Alicyclobacillus dauci]|uniref:Uncharacterized protein n=1 Tax=Alicyclobacillus dauci TaxID=1475485 RepID=A0ABY6Z6S7_9BACL|nr:hypothetical protein [Alicyclobacillus dauci]WAH38581.1 hypothetical protein NZD86_08915 [Alicyclobacillus dauci]